ncbi:RNA polymerase ii-associated, paf1 [Niveomyces insectorum RCEF 264]|uniref:RNA polymerase ii-associated, paf1 n=1 Tax=Niveomyces insectorum RCEF 264 TaxID=1081102 RepID=A0A167Y6X0_9HYPO|nr:RNA polymerase ii-associated, paf1 [Niveomyces insectorum RCEF 264]
MSSSASRGGAGERAVHQDFIARIRYANTLPPPPNPPKLLEIPNTGLGSGYYTSPAFASRLAREQPLNIEADAELGMPLDLIGMPGVFDGDESVIQAAPHPPPVHPRDRALLKPLSTLGKPRSSEAAVSFLRRTEYISSVASKGSGTSVASPLRASKAALSARRGEKRPSPEPDAGTPAYVKRKIEQSFAAAQAAARDGYARVRHPTKKNLRLAAAYPLLPDLGAFPDSGAYVTVKFSNNPVVAGSGVYDTRLLSGIFKPVGMTEEQRLALEAATKAWERDPRRNPRPQNRMQYEFYLPDQAATGAAFRRAFEQADKTDDQDDEDAERFTFNRIRSYESVEEKELTHETKYAEEILLAFTENAADAAPDLGGPVAGGPRAALYYPVMQRTVVRSQRQKQIARGVGDRDGGDGLGDELGEERPVDRLQVAVRAPPEDMREHIARIRADPLHFQDEEADAEGDAEETQPAGRQPQQPPRRHHDQKDDDDGADENDGDNDDDDADNTGNGRARSNRSTTPAGRTNGNGRARRVDDEDEDEDEDAEGDEED